MIPDPLPPLNFLPHPHTNPVTSIGFKRALSDSVALSIHFLVHIPLCKPSATLFQTHPTLTYLSSSSIFD